MIAARLRTIRATFILELMAKHIMEVKDQISQKGNSGPTPHIGQMLFVLGKL